MWVWYRVTVTLDELPTSCYAKCLKQAINGMFRLETYIQSSPEPRLLQDCYQAHNGRFNSKRRHCSRYAGLSLD